MHADETSAGGHIRLPPDLVIHHARIDAQAVLTPYTSMSYQDDAGGRDGSTGDRGGRGRAWWAPAHG